MLLFLRELYMVYNSISNLIILKQVITFSFRYYISTREGKPGERHIYAITDRHHKSPKNITCLTCDIDPDCLYNDATFSPGYTYYVLECLGPGIPRIELRETESNLLGQ